MFLEQLPLVSLGEPVAEVLSGQDGAHEEGSVRPVEDVGIQRAVTSPFFVDSLDRDVVIAHLRTRRRRTITVEDDPADGIQGAE